MPKNIVILLDGTSNAIKENRSNILRLYGTLQKNDEQVVYYDPGVGTFGADSAWLSLWRKAHEVWGLMTGWGLDQNVKEAYRFLVEHYDNGKKGGGKSGNVLKAGGTRDRIYIFGFSRGAYTARVLAGFIHAVGLMEPRNLNLLDYAYKAYKRIGEYDQQSATQEEKDKAFAEVRLFERMLKTDRPPIRMLGLFDTVASVIESGRYGPRLKSHAFTEKNESVQSVTHAVALDERRAMFRPLLWPEGGDYYGNPFNKSAAKQQDVKEQWFTGFHCDVGGGLSEQESELCKVPLLWMIARARQCGLKFNTRSINLIVRATGGDPKYVAPNPLATSHNSMKGFWRLLEFVPRKKPKDSKRVSLFGISLPLFERRHVPDGSVIHASVIERKNTLGVWPENIPANHKVEP